MYFDFIKKNNKIIFDDTTLQEQFQNFLKENKQDINNLNKEELIKLGIYSNIASKIVQYREQLGGFVALEQVKEVKNIDDQMVKILGEYAFVDKNFIPKKLKLNSDEFKVLLRHPYLNFEDVKKICNFRRFEKIRSVEILKKEKLLTEETIKRVRPYLDFC